MWRTQRVDIARYANISTPTYHIFHSAPIPASNDVGATTSTFPVHSGPATQQPTIATPVNRRPAPFNTAGNSNALPTPGPSTIVPGIPRPQLRCSVAEKNATFINLMLASVEEADLGPDDPAVQSSNRWIFAFEAQLRTEHEKEGCDICF